MAASKNVLTTKLDFWVKNQKNVLFIGKHGVGKTGMVKETFDRHKLNWRYFSASTMDPWVDFVGVPKEHTDNKVPEQFEIIKELSRISVGIAVEWVCTNWHMNADSAAKIVEHAIKREPGLTYLDLVRPQTFAAGEVEALFFDEYNRAPKKVRNAVMELIQFKSINGLKFPNLKIVWAAINPDDDEETYDVERLDPAQADRYHITVEVPYKPNKDWFVEKYGARISEAAIQWWDELDEAGKNIVSPRRLQYALDVYQERGDVRDVIPYQANSNKLTSALNNGPITEKLEALMKKNDLVEARTFLQNENNYASAIKFITTVDTLTSYFLPMLPNEKLATLMSENDKMFNHILSNSSRIPVFQHVCKEILDAGSNARLTKRIRRYMTENQDLATSFATGNISSEPAPRYFTRKESKDYSAVLTKLNSQQADTEQQKIILYDSIVNNIPETITADQAVDTLELLNKICSSNTFASAITTKPFENLIGIVNNCIFEIQRNTNYDWNTILLNYGQRFKGLLEKIKTAGLLPKLKTDNTFK